MICARATNDSERGRVMRNSVAFVCDNVRGALVSRRETRNRVRAALWRQRAIIMFCFNDNGVDAETRKSRIPPSNKHPVVLLLQIQIEHYHSAFCRKQTSTPFPRPQELHIRFAKACTHSRDQKQINRSALPLLPLKWQWGVGQWSIHLSYSRASVSLSSPLKPQSQHRFGSDCSRL